ncbi:F-box/LRR-repeat protein 4-like [Rosa chinensis]|uniref:F-box/LRR-repeat protein 4-like n=1 Tax=Rosa chinensis TaxID=74649 RepID=UPI000D090871|nr:F-box/LRR-repeat protein 4-like [Rosa chinensis]
MVSHTKELGKLFLMSDDFVGLIISKVSIKDDRKSFSEVCKQWFKVEGLSRSSLRVFADRPGFSLAALTRFPNLVHLEIFELQTDIEIEIIAQTCRKIESITVFCFDAHQEGHGGILRGKGLMALGNGCPKLSKVMLAGEDTVRDSGIIALLHSKHSFDALVFLSNSLITDQALRAIGLASSISILELVGCSGIKDMGLGFLANGSTSKTLKKLVLNLCRGITDTGVKLLQKMCSLEHLELSYCGRRGEITDIGGVAISAIQTLKEIKLDGLLGVSDPTMLALAQNCCNLEILDLEGCQGVTGAGIRAFSSHQCLKRLVLLGLRNFNLSDVESVAFGCPSLESESVVVDSLWKLDATLMQDNTRRVLKFTEMS